MKDKYLGTSGYMPPEVYMDRCYDQNKIDSWSLGVLLYNLITGKMPYQGEGQKVIMQVINKKKNPKYNCKAWKQCSPKAKDLVKSLLHKDPKSRLDLNQVLEHPWIQPTPVQYDLYGLPVKTPNVDPKNKYLKRSRL